VVIEELSLLKDLADSRKSGFWRKLKSSNYLIPIIIVVFLLFGISAYFTWSTTTEPFIEETIVIESEYHSFYDLFGAMDEGNVLEIYYNVGGNQGIDFYIFDESNYEAWFTGNVYDSEYESKGNSKGTISYTAPKDGKYYVVFENLNADPVTVDVKIEDKDVELSGYYCFLPLTIILLILLVFLLIPQELMPDPESETSSFDYYNVDNTNGYILFGLGWFFAIFSLINLFSFLGSTLLSVSLYNMSSFYILIMLALSLPISFVCFEYSEANGFRNPWKWVGK